jgi:cell division protein ZapA
MAQVMVTIAGKVYRMACGDGEEAHLERLAGIFDGRIAELHNAFGEIGDMRLHVMAALTVLDELEETKKRVTSLEREAASLRDALGAGSDRASAVEARTAEAIAHAAERIERIARSLSPQSSLQPA